MVPLIIQSPSACFHILSFPSSPISSRPKSCSIFHSKEHQTTSPRLLNISNRIQSFLVIITEESRKSLWLHYQRSQVSSEIINFLHLHCTIRFFTQSNPKMTGYISNFDIKWGSYVQNKPHSKTLSWNPDCLGCPGILHSCLSVIQEFKASSNYSDCSLSYELINFDYSWAQFRFRREKLWLFQIQICWQHLILFQIVPNFITKF